MTFDPTFGDDEPEDGWDADDTIDAQLANLRLRMQLLEASISSDFARVAELDALTERLIAWRLLRATVTPREALRADDLEADLAFVRSRI